MVVKHYNKSKEWIAQRRFSLLLLSTVLVLVLPAFSGKGKMSDLLFWVTMTFLFIQSALAADIRKKLRIWITGFVMALILITLLKPIGLNDPVIELIKLVLFASFFFYIIIHLFRYVRRSKSVNLDVLITSVNIYLLFGIIAACLSFLLYTIYPHSYNFPDHISEPSFVTFLYYSFITMSTVGYGDITPRIAETQTLAYFTAITGQLYVAVIIAFLVGKFLVQADQTKKEV